MKVKLQPEEYIIAALNEIPEALDYILLLAQRCDGDTQSLGVDIYNWLHNACNQGNPLIEDRMESAVKRLPVVPLTEGEVCGILRHNFFRELLK